MYVRVSPSSSSPTRVILKFLSSSVTKVRALAVGILLGMAVCMAFIVMSIVAITESTLPSFTLYVKLSVPL